MERGLSIFRNPMRLMSDDFMDNFFGEPLMKLNYSQFEVDMYEDENNVIVELKAPGFKEDSISINLEDNLLNISGTTSDDKEKKKNRKYYYKEMRQESFARSISLPVKVKAEDAQAHFNDGILKIVLPKAEEVKPKRIQIGTSKK